MPLEQKRPAYQADVTYGTNSEFGFDYLRDNMVTRPERRVQRGHAYAIVDEVDSILIDEARTPLIISAPAPSRQIPIRSSRAPFAVSSAARRPGTTRCPASSPRRLPATT